MQEEIKILKDKDKKHEQKENDLNNLIKDLKKEMQEITKYIKEKLSPDEEDEKEIKNYYCVREIKQQSKDNNEIEIKKLNDNTPKGKDVFLDIFIFGVNLYLFEDKIKIKISEIQDNLKANYLIYESNFKIEDFGKIEDYYIQFGGIEIIFKFLCELFENNKDSLIKEDDKKIMIKIKFPCGLKEEEIILNVFNKELSLDNKLKNLNQSIKYINKENKKIKEEIKEINSKTQNEIKNFKKENDNTKILFQKEIFEKIYPIGSYYWTQSTISPEKLFGGKWEQIFGRFLFATDGNHSLGSTGGEETHVLTINEMPSHNHGYNKFYVDSYYYHGDSNDGYKLPANTSSRGTNWYASDNTSSVGSTNGHNNMPPYLTANCWRRIG